MKEVFIISTGKIVKAHSAGSRRILNIAKSLAAGGTSVFLCSYSDINENNPEFTEYCKGVYHLISLAETKYEFLHLFGYLTSVNKFIRSRQSEKVLYLYPTTFIGRDLIYLIYFKLINRHRLFCDINELRATNVFSSVPPSGIIPKTIFYLKSVYDFLTYKLSEIQTFFYDGIVVISSNLERYYKRFNKKIIRIPILCDVDRIRSQKTAPKYDDIVFRICFAGYILCRKEGFEILFESLGTLNRVKNVELYLYGIMNPDDERFMEHLKEKFHLRRKVFYMGDKDPDNLPDEFSKYHLLIIPRQSIPQARYGFSTKLSEYLVSEVPVLVTDVSDNSLYIKDGYNGFIVPPGSAQAMTSKILKIMESYNQTSPIIVDNAHRTAREKLDYHMYTDDFINFFFKNERAYKNIKSGVNIRKLAT